MNYGYIENDLLETLADRIVKCLGGSSNAKAIILETAMVETKLGEYTDRTIYAGLGLCQFDRIPFKDIKERSMRYRTRIKNMLGIDIKHVYWESLRYSPELSLLFCRLHYLLKPGVIPSTKEGRAEYWKKWYNTKLGSGTVEDYLRANRHTNW